MPTLSYGRYRAADQLALLRIMALMLKLCLTFVFADTFGLSLHSPALNLTLILEACYLGFTFWLRKPLLSSEAGLFIALVLDTLLWISWLYFSGGATNAFISLLLLPIAIAAVLLPFWAPWSLALLSNLAYSLMLFATPDSSMSHHGMDMQSHYLGMWVNFIISSLVLTTSVALLAKRMRRQDAQLAFMREAQLRQEKLIALGTASAQMAHRLATPLGSLRLLVEELQEEATNDGPALQEMKSALSVCEATLMALRNATESIRDGAVRTESVEQLVSGLRDQVNLLMPAVKLELQPDKAVAKLALTVDASLQPALLALIENGARASQEKIDEMRVTLLVLRQEDELVLSVRDFGAGIPAPLLQQLGHQIVEQPKGMGVALLLSHASLERLGGRLILGSHVDGGAVAQVYLPIVEA